MIIWNETEAFVEYLKFTKNLFKIKKYLIEKDIDFTLTYKSFLLKNYNNFFVKLLTCPLCLNFWLCFIGSFIFGYSFIFIPFVYIMSLIIYLLVKKLL